MRCEIYEQALTAQGVEWEYVEKVSIEDIDLAKGLRNQARLDMPLDTNLVDHYAARKRAGDKFPAPVLWRAGKGRWIPLDGNQRLAADVKCRHKTTDAYVVKTPDVQISDRISWTFNQQVNGKRLSQEECEHHALTFCRKYGWDAKRAAEEWGVDHWRLRFMLRVKDVEDALDRQKVRRTPSLTETKMKRLAPLLQVGEDVLAQAAEVVAHSGVAESDVDLLIKDVKRAKTHDDKLKAVQDFAQSDRVVVSKAHTKNGTVVTKNDPRARLISLLGQVEDILSEYPAKALRPPLQDDLKRARECSGVVVEKLCQVFGLGAVPREAAS